MKRKFKFLFSRGEYLYALGTDGTAWHKDPQVGGWQRIDDLPQFDNEDALETEVKERVKDRLTTAYKDGRAAGIANRYNYGKGNYWMGFIFASICWGCGLLIRSFF